MLKNDEPNTLQSKHKRAHSKWVSFAVVLLASGMMLTGLYQLFDRHKATTDTSKPPTANVVVTQDVKDPAETKPDEATYAVAADMPRSITLSTISAHGLVQQVGITKENAIATPNNINVAGWYTSSVKPGQDGLSIIDGHVTGKYSDGIFKGLKKLQEGDMFAVEFGDNSNKRFKVVEIKILPEKDATAVLLAKREDIAEQLNLITCGGKFNRATQKYDDRVIVVARAD